MDIKKKNQIIVILYFPNKDRLLKRHNIHEVYPNVNQHK